MAKDLTETPSSANEAYDDRPFHARDLPPEVRAPLAGFEGAEPPAPQWFRDALAQAPERTFVDSLGSKLELLTWGEVGKPGLLLVHGNSAHADWWSYIAPLLAKDYRVAAMSLAGMGASGWRDRYAFSDFSEDAEACARAAGLHEGGRKPVYVGHSYGGAQVFFAAARRPERMHCAVIIDTGFGGPPPELVAERDKRMEQIRSLPPAERPTRIYPTFQAALARFRLMPPQPAGNLFIADYIARHSLKRAPLPDGSGLGWTWKFDPEMWEKSEHSDLLGAGGMVPRLAVPMAYIFGDRSLVVERHAVTNTTFLADEVVQIEIPDSHHHIMIDQPLALVAALRTLLATWPA